MSHSANEKKRHERDMLRRLTMYKACFSTDAGKYVLSELERVYCNNNMFSNDSLVMARNAAQYDLIATIKQLVGHEIKGDADDR